MQVTRRDFSRLGAMAALSTTLPRLEGQSGENSGRKLGWGIVGLGRISMDHFMPGVALSKSGKITALVSGHREKAEKQAAMYNVPSPSIYSYDNYDEIARDKDIDAVYIALPNSIHAEYTIRAAKAGKHVLCEKPMATSVADCRAMIEACAKHRVKLMIAYRCQYQPQHLQAIEIIRSGKIGQVQVIESAFGFPIDAGEWRLNKKLAGGGPLMDVGIYSLNACRYLTGEEPGDIKANASVIDHDGRFGEVEENVGWTMKFPSGILASCNTTYGGDMGGGGFFKVHGAKGWVAMEPAFPYNGMRLTAHSWDGMDLDVQDAQKDPAQFTTQADYFADCVWNNREPKTDGQEGLRDMSLISQIYEAAGMKGL
ncbi:MAG TPA: Gfo/Idh/MocA family oxidoreductase [Acidobacteriaceae bacterium]|jgi:predicted dehydrogenase|nr:Gfo/Idh/MocA family oxidoreductase [Acidobacteriaceae bacterium]